MKIQCPCGSKFNFEVQPEMLAQPGKFVCAQCGADWSDYINGLIRQELMGAQQPTAAPALEPAPAAPEPAPAPDLVPAPPPAAQSGLRVRVHTGARPAEESAATTDVRFCTKHPGQRPVEHCVVCKKPLCPKCMELFGYVCSPLCRQRADLQSIDVPVFAGQKSVSEGRQWRKAGLMVGLAAVFVAALVGAWVCYEYVGSHPGPIYSYRFNDWSQSGRR